MSYCTNVSGVGYKVQRMYCLIHIGLVPVFCTPYSLGYGTILKESVYCIISEFILQGVPKNMTSGKRLGDLFRKQEKSLN